MLGRTEKTTYTLSGRTHYDIAFEDRISWLLDSDPTMTRTSVLVYDGYALRITNEAEGLRIVFQEVGGSDIFETGGVAGSNPEDFIDFKEFSKRKAKRVILPGQGYQLIFVRYIPTPRANPPGTP
jgi:hypothetical protein